MELLQLRYFFESAKHESFAKTAQAHMVPITSVSASVKRLEQELNCTLFDRQANRIVLNERGRLLQNSLCLIFDELSRVTEALSPTMPESNEIKISVRALRNEITDCIIAYTALHPQVSFKTIFDFKDSHEEDYDIIIDDKPERYFEYNSFELCSKRICLKASNANPLCNQKLYLRQLCNQPFISFGEHTNSHKMLVSACKNEGFTPNFVVQTNDLQCYYKYIEAGIGIGISRLDSGSEHANCQSLDIVDFTPRQTISAFYKSQSARGNIKDFLEFLKTKCF